MNIRNPALVIILLGLTGFYLSSCDDYKNCNSPVDTYLGIGFYQILHNEERDSSLPALTLFGIGREDSLLANRVSLDNLFVPLRQSADSSRFYLQPDSTSQQGDTLTVKYKRDLHFVSAGCGFTTFYTLDTIYTTHHHIDSLYLQSRTINTNNATNIKIYY